MSTDTDFTRMQQRERRPALRHWLDEQAEETPEMLAAIDAGLAALKQKGTTTPTRAELETKVRRWSGVSA